MNEVVKKAKRSSKNLVWIDMEMTGLDPVNDKIIEIATIITDSNLKILAEGPVLAVHQDTKLLDSMDEWNTKHHNKSGLVEKVKQSKISESMAAQLTLDFINQYVKPKKSPLCGNSVHQDRRFLALYMPKLEEFFHYRNLDVSTVKELARRWVPDMAKGFKKKTKHEALSDILESIEELQYYREHFFKFPEKK